MGCLSILFTCYIYYAIYVYYTKVAKGGNNHFHYSTFSNKRLVYCNPSSKEVIVMIGRVKNIIIISKKCRYDSWVIIPASLL